MFFPPTIIFAKVGPYSEELCQFASILFEVPDSEAVIDHLILTNLFEKVAVLVLGVSWKLKSYTLIYLLLFLFIYCNNYHSVIVYLVNVEVALCKKMCDEITLI